MMQDNVQNDPGPPPEEDPKTWYGLVWRIVRAAIENDENFKRVYALIGLIAVVLTIWLVAGLAHLSGTGVFPARWLIWALGG